MGQYLLMGKLVLVRHTMEGKDEPKSLRGIIPRTFEHIFRAIKGTPNVQFLVRVSFLELYNEEIRDL